MLNSLRKGKGAAMFSVFEPEVVEAMGRAFEMVIAKLEVRDVETRELIAFKIVSAARAGEVDPEEPCDAAVSAIPVQQIA